MSVVQEILLQQALADADKAPDPSVAMAVGGTGGAALGALAMSPVHYAGNGVNTVKSALGMKMHNRMLGRIRPGFRAAGGLVGMIAGGGLGAGAANMMKQESPAGRMLAQIQATGGQISMADEIRLQSILNDYYQNNLTR